MLVEVNYKGKKMVVKWEEGTGFFGFKQKDRGRGDKESAGQECEDCVCEGGEEKEVLKKGRIWFGREGKGGGMGKNYTFNFYQ
eukprot:gene12517-13802_t